MLKQLDIYRQKEKENLDLSLPTYTKVISKLSTDLNIKWRITLLGRKSQNILEVNG